MNTKYLFTAIAVVIVAIIGLFIYNSSQNDAELASNSNSAQNVNSEAQSNTNTANTNTPANTNTTEEPTTPDGNDVAVFEVVYDGKAYAPSQMTIKNGDVVIFKNESDEDFWPASGPHPTHTVYPEFDPRKPVAAGQTWKFKFTRVGSWSYHDHLNPSAFGKITVE